MKVDEYGRVCGYVDQATMDQGSNNKGAAAGPAPEGKEENLITSRQHVSVEVEDRDKWYHRPVLDIDFPARLVPSSTPGHFHLYLDGVLIPHDKYMYLLATLASCGIIQDGYLKYSVERGYTAVRVPGNFKPKEPDYAYKPKHMKPSVPTLEDALAAEAQKLHDEAINNGIACSDPVCPYCDIF